MVSAPNRWKDTHLKITVFMSSTRRDKRSNARIITESVRSSVAIKKTYEKYTDIFYRLFKYEVAVILMVQLCRVEWELIEKLYTSMVFIFPTYSQSNTESTK